MRLLYVPNPPLTNTPDEEAILARVQARRAPGPLQALDLTLLHAPYIADGWNSFLGAIRTRLSLPDDIRELSILRVAALTGSGFELAEHTPYARRAGVSEQALETVRNGQGDGLSEKQGATVAYAEAMTRDVRVSQQTFDTLRSHFSEKQVVEITATVAAINCAARFLVSLDVGEFNEK